MIFYSIYYSIALINVVLILAMGIYVLRIDTRIRLAALFFFKCLIISIYITCATITAFIPKENLIIFYKLTMCMATITVYIIFRFYAALAMLKMKRWIDFVFVIPALFSVMLILMVKSPLILALQMDHYWKIIPDFNNLFFVYWPVYLVLFGLSTYYMMHKWRKESTRKKDKKQAQIISFAGIIFLAMLIMTDLILPSFSFFKLPYLCPLFFSLYIGAVFYALVKYRFLSFSKKDIANEIFSNVQDIIFILNSDATVMEANDVFYEANPDFKKPITNLSFQDTIIDDGKTVQLFEELVSGKRESFNSKIIYKAKPENIMTDSYVSRIIDSYGDCLGIIVISRINHGISQFIKIFKISKRQMDIILLSIDGDSNVEIAEKLKIARRTVETHLSYIYLKLMVNNKVGLINIANKFNIK